jgi:excisionase family DNA binding protein
MLSTNSPVAVSVSEPLVVRPRDACRLLAVGNTRLYELIGAGELETYLDGRARRITMDSIRRYIARRLGTTNPAPTEQPRRRGRPRKDDATRVTT